MRTTKDRIRHTVFFEMGLVILFSAAVLVILKKDLVHVGGLTLCLSSIAMVVNYFYNIIFDRVLLRLGFSLANRTLKLRALHAVLFEVSLLLIALPIISLILELSLWQAFLTDLGFCLFTIFYAFIFNWTYDFFLPVPNSNSI